MDIWIVNKKLWKFVCDFYWFFNDQKSHHTEFFCHYHFNSKLPSTYFRTLLVCIFINLYAQLNLFNIHFITISIHIILLKWSGIIPEQKMSNTQLCYTADVFLNQWSNNIRYMKIYFKIIYCNLMVNNINKPQRG